MPGTPGVADLINQSNIVQAHATDAADQIMANAAESARISSDTVGILNSQGNIDATNAALATSAAYQTQSRKQTLANSLGIVDGADILVEQASDMRDAYRSKMDHVKAVEDMENAGIQDDPLGWLYNQIKGLPDERKLANQDQLRLATAQSGYAAITAALQTGAKTYDDLNAGLDAGSADRAAQLALGKTALVANAAQQDALQKNSAAVRDVLQMDGVKLDAMSRVNGAINADRSYALQQQEFAFRKEQAAKQAARDDLSEAETEQLLDWYNKGRSALQGSGLDPVNMTTFKNLLKVDKNTGNYVQMGMGIATNPGRLVPVAGNAMDAIDVVSKTRAPLVPAQSEALDWAKSQIAGAFTGQGTAKPGPLAGAKINDSTKQTMDQLLLASAKGASMNLTGASNGNPYELPGLGAALQSAALAGTPFATVMAASAANPANKTFNPQLVAAEVAANVASGKLSFNDAVEGLSRSTSTLMELNNQARKFQQVNLPVQQVAGARLPLPGFSMQGDDSTGKPVNLTDKTAVSAWLTQYLARKNSAQAASAGLFF